MVLGIIGIAAAGVAIPLAASSTSTSVIGIAQSTNASQQSGGSSKDGEPSEADKNDPRLAKFTIHTRCSSTASGRREVHKKQVVLRHNKLYIDHIDLSKRKYQDGHAFAGFYIDYPWEKKPLGLVSTIQPDPPELNWIYIDKNTLQVKYGNKTASLPHLPGPWDWTEDHVGVTLGGREAFVALEESPGNWILCYDALDKERIGGRRVLEISLDRHLL